MVPGRRRHESKSDRFLTLAQLRLLSRLNRVSVVRCMHLKHATCTHTCIFGPRCGFFCRNKAAGSCHRLSLSPVARIVTAESLCLLAAASETDTCRAVFVRCSVPARRRRTPNNTFSFRRLCAREPPEILTGAAAWRPSGFYLRRGRHMAVHGSVQMQRSTASPAIQASNVDAV